MTAGAKLRAPRQPLDARPLPDYTRGEEIFNMVSHIVGSTFAVGLLVFCVLRSAFHHNVWGIVTGAIFAASMILCYTISSVYHGLIPKTEKLIRSKKVMQVLDHCDIYFLIAGTYTPIALTGLRETHPGLAWSTFGIMWDVCLIGTVFTAIDLHKFGPLSYACYFIAGWSALISLYAIGRTYGTLFVLFLLAGGIAYTSGMVFFVRQTKGYRYSHSIFHLFILAGSVLHAIPIILWCM